MSKKAKIVIYEKVRVSGGSNYEYPGERWVLNLVQYKIILDYFLTFYNIQLLITEGFTKNIRAANETERAGGYVESIGCLRAVQEAMAGLYFQPVVEPLPFSSLLPEET